MCYTSKIHARITCVFKQNAKTGGGNAFSRLLWSPTNLKSGLAKFICHDMMTGEYIPHKAPSSPFLSAVKTVLFPGEPLRVDHEGTLYYSD